MHKYQVHNSITKKEIADLVGLWKRVLRPVFLLNEHYSESLGTTGATMRPWGGRESIRWTACWGGKPSEKIPLNKGDLLAFIVLGSWTCFPLSVPCWDLCAHSRDCQCSVSRNKLKVGMAWFFQAASDLLMSSMLKWQTLDLTHNTCTVTNPFRLEL